MEQYIGRKLEVVYKTSYKFMDKKYIATIVEVYGDKFGTYSEDFAKDGGGNNGIWWINRKDVFDGEHIDTLHCRLLPNIDNVE